MYLTGSSYDEQVTSQGYELKAISGGTALPALSAGTLFTSGGTYNTYTWWSAEGTNGETYYLGTYVDENSTAIFPMVTENVHPSAWTSSTKTSEKAWMIDNWRGHQTYMVELPAEDTWIYQDDADSGYHHLEFDYKVEDGAVECPSFTGFTGSYADFNGVYKPNGETTTVTASASSWVVPVYSNGIKKLFGATNPEDFTSIIWAMGTDFSVPEIYSSNSLSDGETLMKHIAARCAGEWRANGATVATPTVEATFWTTGAAPSFTDITPGDADPYGSWITMQGGQSTQMLPDNFYRYQETDSTLTAWIVPPEDLENSKTWRATLSFNGNLGLSGAGYTLFGLDGVISAAATPTETYLLPRDGVYEFFWHTTREVGGKPSAYIKPVGFFE